MKNKEPKSKSNTGQIISMSKDEYMERVYRQEIIIGVKINRKSSNEFFVGDHVVTINIDKTSEWTCSCGSGKDCDHRAVLLRESCKGMAGLG